jgi:Eco57I restriction-modification methylase
MTTTFGSLENARKAIGGLVARYRANRDRYRAASYNEETCRNEFISPLMEALGWDLVNRQGAAEQYKDVIHEEGIKVGDFTKAPDYTFRFGGQRKFFLEAKKPFLDLKSDPEPAYQLRRYAWSAKLPLSILTDFEEFVVYDTRTRPREGDKPSIGRIMYYTFEELLTNLEEIWGIFSKDAVLKGSFDRYTESSKGKRGTSEVDAEFLLEIEGWRDALAKNFANRNRLSADELNFAVQATIDRIILLRIAEGRAVEPYAQLLTLTNNPKVYRGLVELFRKADVRYNSGIFDFRSDVLTPSLAVDDKVIKPILKNLYYPQSPYEFSVIPVEIIGDVYEQFLGKVIRLTKGGHAVIEEKPEIKKAGGVYYTPAYIVNYIVKNTLGRLTVGKNPSQLEKLKILDPACGSGSFLLSAYQHLLDTHLAWYSTHSPKSHKKQVFMGPGGGWRLTTPEKRRILLNNIYGVDIDRQAVEVTKLSLLLKVLEGENQETIEQGALFGERALPSLEENILCGNSLVSDDMRGPGLFEDGDLRRRVNPFDWKRRFGRHMTTGFDAVIGNPPYAYRNATEEELRSYYDEHYKCAEGNYDTYKFFVERSLTLVRPKGLVGMIVSASFFVQPTFAKLRKLLLEQTIILLGPLGPGAFAKATVDTSIVILRREPPPVGTRSTSIVAPAKPTLLLDCPAYEVTQDRFARNEGFVFDYRLTDDAAKVVDRIHKAFPPIEDGFEFGVGINTGFIRGDLVSDTKKDSRYHRMVPGSGISRYGSVNTDGWIMYDAGYVRSRGAQGRSLPPERFFDLPKILVVRTRNLALAVRIIATIDTSGAYNLNRLSNIIPRQGYSLSGLLGILNSSAFNWLFSTRYYDYEIKPVYLRRCPMPDVNHPPLVRAVELLMKKHSEHEAARMAHSRDVMASELLELESRVDELVEDLYGLNVRERKLLDAYRHSTIESHPDSSQGQSTEQTEAQ